MPRSLPTGLQMAYGKYTTVSGTLSVGDVIQLVKIPNNARIIDGWAKWSKLCKGDGVVQVNFGTRADQDGFVVSATASAAGLQSFKVVGAALLGELSTVTDSAAQRYTMVEALIGGTSLTGTGTISIECCVVYQLDTSL